MPYPHIEIFDEDRPTPVGANEFEYWYTLIDEDRAGDFLDLTKRSMQAMRQAGGGPRFIRLSARCIRYRRIDLREYSEARLRSSTSDPGPEAGA